MFKDFGAIAVIIIAMRIPFRIADAIVGFRRDWKMTSNTRLARLQQKCGRPGQLSR